MQLFEARNYNIFGNIDRSVVKNIIQDNFMSNFSTTSFHSSKNARIEKDMIDLETQLPPASSFEMKNIDLSLGPICFLYHINLHKELWLTCPIVFEVSISKLYPGISPSIMCRNVSAVSNVSDISSSGVVNIPIVSDSWSREYSVFV